MRHLSFLFIAFLIFASGCSQKEKKIEQYLESGNVEEALELASSLYAKEPANSVRIALLRKSRTKWIEKKLIDVRLLRLAGSELESEQLLNKILSSQREWQLFPTGAVFSTQKEEIDSRTQANKNLIFDALKKNLPVLAHVIYQRSQDLFVLAPTDEAEKIKTQIKSSGQKFCTSSSSQMTEIQFYFQTSLRKTCLLWSANLSDHKTKNSVTLFSKLKPNFAAKGLSLIQTEVFSKNLDQAFEQSLWFDQQSDKSLPLEISGEFTNLVEEKVEDKQQKYTEQVAYEESRIVPKGVKERQEARDSNTTVGTLIFDVVMQLITGPEVKERFVENNDGTVTAYYKRYRPETRVYNYKATKVTQNIGINLDVKIPITSKPLNFSFKASQQIESYEHGINAPAMGISPEHRQTIAPDEWLVTQALALNTRLNEELKAVWENAFCKNEFVIAKTATEVEAVHRCAYGLNGSTPVFVETWFQNTLGVSFVDWRNARPL